MKKFFIETFKKNNRGQQNDVLTLCLGSLAARGLEPVFFTSFFGSAAVFAGLSVFFAGAAAFFSPALAVGAAASFVSLKKKCKHVNRLPNLNHIHTNSNENNHVDGR